MINDDVFDTVDALLVRATMANKQEEGGLAQITNMRYYQSIMNTTNRPELFLLTRWNIRQRGYIGCGTRCWPSHVKVEGVKERQ